jgi:hypothetical protein
MLDILHVLSISQYFKRPLCTVSVNWKYSEYLNAITLWPNLRTLYRRFAKNKSTIESYIDYEGIHIWYAPSVYDFRFFTTKKWGNQNHTTKYLLNCSHITIVYTTCPFGLMEGPCWSGSAVDELEAITGGRLGEGGGGGVHRGLADELGLTTTKTTGNHNKGIW